MCNTFAVSNLTSVSFDPPQCPLEQSNALSTAEFSNVFDNNEETCYNFSDEEYVTLSLEFLSLDSGINHFRFIMNASQDCYSDNFLWLIGGETVSIKPMECEVNQDTSNGNKLCEITCYCVCAIECSRAYFQSQQLPWLDNHLSICHWAQVLTGQVEPEVIQWIRLGSWSHSRWSDAFQLWPLLDILSRSRLLLE